MELRHLRYFVAVAETENVSRAALKLHVSQPALSRQIRDLEEELGFTLLERTAKSVRLTAAGQVFLIEARAVLQRAQTAVESARAIATGGKMEIHAGYAPTLAVRILPSALRTFHLAMPNVRVKLHDLSSEEMLRALREAKLQVAVAARPSSNAMQALRFEELTREPLRLAVGLMHPFAERRFVSIADAAREPFIAYSQTDYPDYHEMLKLVFGAKNQRPLIKEEHDGVSSLVAAIAACNGVSIVPDSMSCVAGAQLKLIPLMPEPAPLEIGMIRRKGVPDAATEEFLNALRKEAKKTAK